MFNRISYRIAAQFTAFCFPDALYNRHDFPWCQFLLTVTGTRRNYLEQMQQAILATERRPGSSVVRAADVAQSRLRVLDASGNSLFSGELYEQIPLN